MAPVKNIPVLAAIPNYNHGETLQHLLPQVLAQEYDGVVVCDDASSDMTPDVLAAYRGDVEVIAGDQNVGAGANRNRVLQSKKLEKLGKAIIHFIDADTSLTSDCSPEHVRTIMEPNDIGLAGGLITDGRTDRQFHFNYGPAMDTPLRFIGTSLTGNVQIRLEQLHLRNPEQANRWRDRLGWLLQQWPDTTKPPIARDVGWVAEGNMIIHSEVFRRIGGFDPKLRFHEVQELVAQLIRRGLRRRFDPDVAVVHHAIDVRGPDRSRQKATASARLLTRYTLRTQPRYNKGYGQTETATT